jgi:hypothetical protein
MPNGAYALAVLPIDPAPMQPTATLVAASSGVALRDPSTPSTSTEGAAPAILDRIGNMVADAVLAFGCRGLGARRTTHRADAGASGGTVRAALRTAGVDTR